MQWANDSPRAIKWLAPPPVLTPPARYFLLYFVPGANSLECTHSCGSGSLSPLLSLSSHTAPYNSKWPCAPLSSLAHSAHAAPVPSAREAKEPLPSENAAPSAASAPSTTATATAPSSSSTTAAAAAASTTLGAALALPARALLLPIVDAGRTEGREGGAPGSEHERVDHRPVLERVDVHQLTRSGVLLDVGCRMHDVGCREDVGCRM